MNTHTFKIVKRLLFIILLLASISANAQVFLIPNNSYGIQFNRGLFPLGLGIPNDTFAVAAPYRSYPFLAAKNDVLYIWSPSLVKWVQYSAGGGGTGGAPTGAAGGDLSSTYPNPNVKWINGYATYDGRYFKITDTLNKWQPKGNYVTYNSNGNVVLGGGADNGAALRVPNGFVDIGGNQGSIWYTNGLGHLQELIAPAGLTSPYVGWDATNTAPKWYAGTNQPITFNASGDVTGTANGTTSLSATLSLPAVVTPGSCTNCNATFDAKGRATAFSSGTGGTGGGTYTFRNSLATGDTILYFPNSSTVVGKTISVAAGSGITVAKSITDSSIVYTITNTGATTSGSYTPTITGNSGITMTNAYVCYWTRIGDIVTVTGQLDVQVVNANTTESLLMSLPILPNTNFSNRYKLNGVMNCEAYYVSGVIYASASQQLAWLSFQMPGTILKDWHFTFTYSATQP